jgi:hypothetical protein
VISPDAGAWWAVLTVWIVVNLVNVLQAAGFMSRPRHGMSLNHTLGWVIAALALPATAALVEFIRAGSGWLFSLGPAVFDGFVIMMLVVDYLHPIEFRSPARYGILGPYLVLFFASILFMGLPMFRINLALWVITATTAALLIASMVHAQRRGVG